MKTTRSNFSRKAITFGVVIFVCIALVATGFAAWMISSGSTVEEKGNVDVVTVSNADIKINMDGLTSEGKLNVADIVFAPQAGDNTGYIQHTDKEDPHTENLSFSFSGNVSNGDKVGTLTFAVKLPDAVVNAAGFFLDNGSWEYDSERAYITLPPYAVDKDGNPLPTIKLDNGKYIKDPNTNNWTAPATITIDSETNLTAGKTDKGFTYKLEGTDYVFDGEVRFGWGEVFGFGNPGRTLDKPDENKYDLNPETPEIEVNPNSFEPFEVEKYSLAEAELLLRLVNFVNAGVELDKSFMIGKTSNPIITSENKVKASAIKLSKLASMSDIAGDGKNDAEKKAAKIANLNAALEEAEGDIQKQQYTIVITAQPK